MKKIIRKIHLWLSVPFGVVIALICFSGAMLALEPEVTRALNREVYYVQQGDTTLPLDMMVHSVARTLPDSVQITGVTTYSDPERAWQVSLSKPHHAALFLNPYTGEVTGKYERMPFFLTMFKLHRWLLDPANPRGEGFKLGKTVVGVSTLMMVVALVSGLALWVYRARKNLKKSLTINFRKGQRIMWKSLHVAGGVYVSLLLLVMSLTGLTWSFDWYRKGFYAVCGVEMQAPQQRNSSESHGGRHGESREHGLASKHKRGERGSQWNGSEHGRGREHGENRQPQASNWQQRLQQLQRTDPGASQYVVDAEPKPATPAGKLKKLIYSLHTGNFGGTFTRVLWMAAALFGGLLPLTGYYIWIVRLIAKKRGRKTISIA